MPSYPRPGQQKILSETSTFTSDRNFCRSNQILLSFGETRKSRVEAFQSTIWKESWQATQFNPSGVHELNGRLVSDSLLAEALFLVFADGRKETSAMGWKWLWFNRRPRSWTALFETHAPCVVCCPQLEPAASRAFVFINSAVTWAHIVNMTSSSARSKECSRKELLSLLLPFWRTFTKER